MKVLNRFLALFLFFSLFIITAPAFAEKNYNSIFYSDDAERYLEKWTSDKNWSDAVVQAQAYYNDKKYNRAMILYEKAFDQGYRSADGFFNLAHCYEIAGETGQAVATYDKAAEELVSKGFVNDTLYESYFRAGLLLAGEKKWNPALEVLEKAREVKANQPELLFNLGVVNQKLGNIEKAKNYYQATLGLEPQFADAKKNLKYILNKSSVPQIVYSEQTYRLKSPVEVSTLKKVDLNILKEKIIELEMKLASVPESEKGDAHYELGLYYFTAGQYKEALAHLNQIPSLRKMDAADFLFGTIYLKLGDTQKGVKAYRRYLRKHKKDPLAHYNLAVLYDNHAKQSKKAIHHYRRYLQLAKADAKDADDVGRRIYILENFRNP